MDRIIEFFTSKGGLIAALVVLLGLISTLLGIIRPMLQRRRDSRAARPRLTFSNVEIKGPRPSETVGHLRFQVMNSGGGRSVLQGLKLVVTEAHPSETLRMIELGAPVPEYHYHVHLNPKTREYDVHARTFGEAPAELSFEENEVESIAVELSSTESWWYRFKIIGEWYDIKHPNERQKTESAELEIDFPPDPAELLAREK